MGHSIGLLDSAEGGMPSPLAPYHLPRSDPGPAHGGRQAVCPQLHVDQERAAAARLGHKGSEALGPPQEAGAPAAARHAGVPGRLEARLAAAGAGTRPDRHDGRRHQRDPLGRPGRGGGDRLEFHRAEGDHRGAGPVLRPLHRPRQPLLLPPQGRRAGGQDPPHPGRAGAQATRHRAHPELLPRATAPRAGVAWSGCSAPSKAACRR